jgi:type IV pilus assembly protein PilA
MKKNQKGFSLIELLIVVAIILIIAAIAIPNLLRARIAANEASAVGSVRTLNTAQVAYSTTYGTGFAPLASLGGAAGCVAGPATACLIDPVLTVGSKSGYVVNAVAATGGGTVLSPFQTFENVANPISVSTGTRSFCSDQSGVIRWQIGVIGTAVGTCAAIPTILQ